MSLTTYHKNAAFLPGLISKHINNLLSLVATWNPDIFLLIFFTYLQYLDKLLI